MTDPIAQASTFERSCQHWSAQGQAGMDAFYRLAAVDYQLLAKQLQWSQIFNHLQNQFGDTVRLLDVACGSGQFPTALLEDGGMEACTTLKVQYSLLDPSEFSINMAGEKLRAPFERAEQWLCTAQALPTPSEAYQVVWATHALYCVPTDELELALDRMLAATDPQGLGFIAHASHASHYLKFHNLYLQTARAGESLPYCHGEQIIELLSGKLDACQLNCWAIDYEGTVGLDERKTVELYLQRCLFDDSISLEKMLDTEPLCSYLHGCMDESSGTWRFPQRTWLIFYGELAQRVNDYRNH